MKAKKPSQKIRLMGHSLGAQVILSAVQALAKNPKNKGIIESVHLFGASIPANSFNARKSGSMFQKTVNKKITNYFSPYDDVLKAANDECWVDSPLGYNGTTGTPISKYTQKMVRPRNHRFASYARTIKSFP